MRMNYIDAMQQVLSAYSAARIEEYLAQVRQKGVWEHGFPRLTANIGVLLSFGRCTAYRQMFTEMMDICCQQVPDAFTRYYEAGSEFSVRELVACILALEEAQTFPPEKLQQWKDGLKKVIPEKAYRVIATDPIGRLSNWVAFSASSEQARIYAGLGDAREFVDRQMLSQLLGFDDNGMYREGEQHSMAYDLVPRLQLATASFYGYNGRYAKALDRLLLRGAKCSLYMQSVTGELPYGGRSIQFIHNEALLAAYFEFAARRSREKGDITGAGSYKAAAKKAFATIAGWLELPQKYHIKNRYSNDSMFGCEKYGYFDKYMITTASFLYTAYLFADDTIDATTCPADSENYIFQASSYFGKTFLKFGDYFVQYDTNADPHYDANGLGRLQKKGAPGALCLSVPFAKAPGYYIGQENPSPMSLCFGLPDGSSADEGTEYILLDKAVDDQCAQVVWLCRLSDGRTVLETCRVTENGVSLRFEGEGPITCYLPVLETDGAEKAEHLLRGNTLRVSWQGWTCSYTGLTAAEDTGKHYANRNGVYRLFQVTGEGQTGADIVISKN